MCDPVIPFPLQHRANATHSFGWELAHPWGSGVGQAAVSRVHELVEHRRYKVRQEHFFSFISYFAAGSLKSSQPGVRRLWGTHFPIFFSILSFLFILLLF